MFLTLNSWVLGILFFERRFGGVWISLDQRDGIPFMWCHCIKRRLYFGGYVYDSSLLLF